MTSFAEGNDDDFDGDSTCTNSTIKRQRLCSSFCFSLESRSLDTVRNVKSSLLFCHKFHSTLQVHPFDQFRVSKDKDPLGSVFTATDSVSSIRSQRKSTPLATLVAFTPLHRNFRYRFTRTVSAAARTSLRGEIQSNLFPLKAFA